MVSLLVAKCSIVATLCMGLAPCTNCVRFQTNAQGSMQGIFGQTDSSEKPSLHRAKEEAAIAKEKVKDIYLVSRENNLFKVSRKAIELAGDFIKNAVEAGESDESEGDENTTHIEVPLPNVPDVVLEKVIDFMNKHANFENYNTKDMVELPWSEQVHGGWRKPPGLLNYSQEYPRSHRFFWKAVRWDNDFILGLVPHKTVTLKRAYLWEEETWTQWSKESIDGLYAFIFRLFHAAVYMGVINLQELLCHWIVLELAWRRLNAYHRPGMGRIYGWYDKTWDEAIRQFKEGLGGSYTVCQKDLEMQADAWYKSQDERFRWTELCLPEYYCRERYTAEDFRKWSS